uniref:Cilia- and flagella-associated protein 36 n=1 Tax=Alexandrium catenella TaxID=2925 RepID=A0A7S1PRL8_ALECA
MAAADDLEWLSDYVVNILKSPTWVTPIAQFIDDQCGLFDDKEENELMHTACHSEFKQLVNELLVSHLLEVSVNPEDFERFCEKGLTGQTRLHRALVDQLLSVDDFLGFKAMMAKHNAELNQEAIISFQVEDDEEPLQDPLSPTRLLADGVVANSIAEGLKTRDAEWQIYEPAFPARKRTLTSESGHSQNDQENWEAQLRLEEAELEQTIALSLQLEEERLRQLTQHEQPVPSPEPSVALEPTPPMVVPTRAGCISAPLCYVPPKLKQPPAPRMMEVECLAPAAKPRGGAWGFTSAPLCPAPPQLLQEPTIVPAAAAAAATPAPRVPKVVGFTSSPLLHRPPAPKPGPASEAPAVPTQALEPVQAPQPVQAGEPTTEEIDGMRSNLQLWRQRAERAFVRPPALNTAAARTLPKAAPAAGPSDEERRQRAEHLARQRDRLREKRQRDRDQQMVDFQLSRGGGSTVASSLDRASAHAARAAEGRRLVAALSPGAVVTSPSAPPPGNAPVIAERMRQAMTLQLRQTLMRTTVSDADTLDGQLSQLELMKSG